LPLKKHTQVLYQTQGHWQPRSRLFSMTSCYTSNFYFLLATVLNPFLLKVTTFIQSKHSFIKVHIQNLLMLYSTTFIGSRRPQLRNLRYSNLLPTAAFQFTLTKQLSSLFSLNKTREDVIPLFYHTLVRFVEHISGKKFLFQFYPFLNQQVSTFYIIRYKSWIPRMSSYERRLGHKFFFWRSSTHNALKFYFTRCSIVR
jgi:hypothetical protein